MKYSEVIENLSHSILTSFDEVHHSAEIITTDLAEKFPAIQIGKTDEWKNLSPSDKQEIIYIRRAGDDEVLEELKLGSCGKAYKMRSSLRIVFFQDHATKQGEIISNLMQSVLIGGTKLKSVIRDKWKLLKDESTGAYNFGPTTAYFAIDIFALWELSIDNCPQDFCLDVQNPLKKELCPAVV